MGIIDKFFGRESRELMALDISSTRVKLLALSGEPGRYQIEAYASENLPAGAIADNQVAEPELVGQTISRAVQRSGTRLRQAAVSVSGSAVISKIIDMPATLSEDEIEQQIGFEADQYIPYPVEEVSLDFQIIGPNEQDQEMNRVLLAACRRDTVEMRLAALEAAGIHARVVDVEGYALQNACQLLTRQMPDEGAGRTVAVVDVGANNTVMNVLHDLEAVYAREQPFGGGQFVESIQQHYGLDSLEEAIAKLRAGEIDENFLKQALTPFAEQVAQQIDRSLQFFFSASTQHDSIDRILLTGGSALLPDLDKLVGGILEIPVAIGNPLAGMRASGTARRNRVEAEAPALMVATGLALRTFH
jgi:type IV pilus assembly protein PilM